LFPIRAQCLERYLAGFCLVVADDHGKFAPEASAFFICALKPPPPQWKSTSMP
jgi:hypothetical protein